MGACCGAFFFSRLFCMGQSRFYSPFTPLRRADTFSLASRFFSWRFFFAGVQDYPRPLWPSFFPVGPRNLVFSLPSFSLLLCVPLGTHGVLHSSLHCELSCDLSHEGHRKSLTYGLKGVGFGPAPQISRGSLGYLKQHGLCGRAEASPRAHCKGGESPTLLLAGGAVLPELGRLSPIAVLRPSCSLQRVLCRPGSVGADEVHCNMLPLCPQEQQDICRSPAS